MTTSTTAEPAAPVSSEPVSAHAGHDLADVSISWGGYEYCEMCKQVLAIDNFEGDIVWQAGRDSAADCRHYLGDRLAIDGLTPGTAS